ncbi:hypothetical protein [Xenorhabdus littoralis]|uniref:hypothetical protein n=1 Tax=Xenorhabdus littoralis TaxID=2582835 RepID=UPI0029E7FF86|nr:hypothetical protein [Xenorhabdus sp. psl]MDX7993272.1 hypothetical protein [Xenorhabdus sp. psl]
MSDEKRGRVYLTTTWDEDIKLVVIRHRRANDPSKQDESSMSDVDAYTNRRYFMPIIYENHWFYDYDYWWVYIITESLKMYTVKDNFYCNIASDDDRDVEVSLDIDPFDQANKYLHIIFSSSSPCRQPIYRIDS